MRLPVLAALMLVVAPAPASRTTSDVHPPGQRDHDELQAVKFLVQAGSSTSRAATFEAGALRTQMRRDGGGPPAGSSRAPGGLQAEDAPEWSAAHDLLRRSRAILALEAGRSSRPRLTPRRARPPGPPPRGDLAYTTSSTSPSPCGTTDLRGRAPGFDEAEGYAKKAAAGGRRAARLAPADAQILNEPHRHVINIRKEDR